MRTPSTNRPIDDLWPEIADSLTDNEVRYPAV